MYVNTSFSAELRLCMFARARARAGGPAGDVQPGHIEFAPFRRSLWVGKTGILHWHEIETGKSFIHVLVRYCTSTRRLSMASTLH